MLPKSKFATEPFVATYPTVKDHGQTVTEFSLKYYQHGRSSVNAQKGYDAQQRLIPTDQMDEADRYLDQQMRKDSATGRDNCIENARELEQVRDTLTDRVHHKGA